MVSQTNLVILLLSVVSVAGIHRHPLHSGLQTKVVKNDVSWDFFMLVIEWPQSSCEYVNATHQHHQCVIPSVVKGWTLHGLWPSTNSGDDPFYCTSDKFDMDKVRDLESDLNKNWANLYQDESESSFWFASAQLNFQNIFPCEMIAWKHEYEKHGTCASAVPRFSGEHNFFQQTLELKKKYDPMAILENASIHPGTDSYQVSQIQDAFNKAFNVKACVECSYLHGQDKQILSVMYLCLNKDDQQPISCSNCEHACRDSEPVYYHPLHF